MPRSSFTSPLWNTWKHPGGLWFSGMLFVLVAASETATHFEPSWNTWLREHFAINWQTLSSGQLHRFLFSPFFQAQAGYSWTILLLVTISVPLYEWNSGSIRTAFTFVLGDILSSSSVLLVLKLAAEFGSSSAARIITEPDSGASAGCFACIGALCVSLPRPFQQLALAGLGGFLVIRIAGWQSLSDCQHAVAALIGILLWMSWKRFVERQSTPLTWHMRRA